MSSLDPHSDRPYILTTSDDRTIKVWDLTTKSLQATLEGHTNNVSFAVYHPELPIIVSGSEDGTIKIWHSGTYRLEQSLSYGLERAWCVSYQKGKQGVGVGFDDGVVVIKMGREEPAISMDASGKVIAAKNNDVVSAIIKPDPSTKDNDPINLQTKDLGQCEVYPQTLQHSPNGRFVAVSGDGEYIIYTALAWRQKGFGSALDLYVSAVFSFPFARTGLRFLTLLVFLFFLVSGPAKTTTTTMPSASRPRPSRSTKTLSRRPAAWMWASRRMASTAASC